MSQITSERTLFFGVVIICFSAICFALYLEKAMGLLPCPLCMTQRGVIVIIGLIALVASIHNSGQWTMKLYWGSCAAFSLLGALVASRHVWLQNLPEGLVPACGPSLEYMLETLPFSETFQLIIMGDGNCAETVWTFVGFTIPQQTLGLFLFLGLISIWQVCIPIRSRSA